MRRFLPAVLLGSALTLAPAAAVTAAAAPAAPAAYYHADGSAPGVYYHS